MRTVSGWWEYRCCVVFGRDKTLKKGKPEAEGWVSQLKEGRRDFIGHLFTFVKKMQEHSLISLALDVII